MSVAEDMPDENRLITVVSARCQECGRSLPGDRYSGSLEERRRINRVIVARWHRRGLTLPLGWPKRLPAYLVREGFACAFPDCGAPNMLLELAAPGAQPDGRRELPRVAS